MKVFETITSILALAHSVISSPLSLNSTMMTQYNEFNDKYNHEFSYDRFENFKKNTKYMKNLISKIIHINLRLIDLLI